MYKFLFIVFFILINTLFASNGDINPKKLALKLNLSAGTKAIIQWERIFKSEKKLKRYKINLLIKEEREALKEYLIIHAIDSDQPTVAGV